LFAQVKAFYVLKSMRKRGYADIPSLARSMPGGSAITNLPGSVIGSTTCKPDPGRCILRILLQHPTQRGLTVLEIPSFYSFDGQAESLLY